jgi:pimeloyl-ACP methyl ester carboxylesterase
MWRLALSGVALVALSACGDAATSADATPIACGVEPALSVDLAEVDKSIGAPETMRGFQPVLLVHGTGSTSFESWHGTYVPALTAAGYDVFTLDLPGKAYVDIQQSSESLVHALRVIAGITGRRVDVITHSQGGLEARWALKWWPSTRALVDDVITLGAPNHGTLIANAYCAPGCKPAHWQQRRGSRFIEAIDAGDDLGVAASATSIYSVSDELVEPELEDATSAVQGASNIAIQDLCPARPVDHVGLMRDGAVYALVVDALTHDGPADRSRVSPFACADLLIPGIGPIASLQGNYYFFASGNSDVPDVQEEPPLAPYVCR